LLVGQLQAAHPQSAALGEVHIAAATKTAGRASPELARCWNRPRNGMAARRSLEPPYVRIVDARQWDVRGSTYDHEKPRPRGQTVVFAGRCGPPRNAVGALLMVMALRRVKQPEEDRRLHRCIGAHVEEPKLPKMRGSLTGRPMVRMARSRGVPLLPPGAPGLVGQAGYVYFDATDAGISTPIGHLLRAARKSRELILRAARLLRHNTRSKPITRAGRTLRAPALRVFWRTLLTLAAQTELHRELRDSIKACF